ncbi:MAG TPA: hypothetical protein VN618_07460 [Solirubrobacteraceae bacterium]|nr:hypothetical protein [Solirubrobacteraceae bacterium]
MRRDALIAVAALATVAAPTAIARAEAESPPSFSQAPALSPARFSAKPVRGRAASYLVFAISEAAHLEMRVYAAAAGRRAGGVCRAPSAANRARPHCRRWVLRGTLSTPALAGANRIPFTPRVSGRALKPGAYRLRIVATDGAGAHSAPASAGFTITP